ncbi:hypothetical protein [Dactylosporangium salmoneum]|uniref:Uncharacterized protein n=1 Tax=Dactylosporangium salmoneum TaxID=53361 RepID=A0ABN3H796_9ACTN
MDPLTEHLRTLDPPAPPSAVDLDAVVARGLRRRALTRYGGVAAAGLAAVLAGTTVAALPSRTADQPRRVCALPAEPTSSLEPPVPATPAAGSESAALAAALRPLLEAAFPRTLVVQTGTCDEDWTFDAPAAGGYAANLDLYDAEGMRWLSVRILRADLVSEAACTGMCTRTVEPDGTVVRQVSTAYDEPGAVTLGVWARHPDDRLVVVEVSNFRMSQATGVLRYTVTRPGNGITLAALRPLALSL